ncbi:serine/threonine-protein phosphatase 7 long form homolog [Rutidosis leptorrhynchoides]|uniref:serine/threonine-protein phosphatase 7 long form homolog n=1 Tax=Rutidosis leptorrhynchoides TaxID=125765 RepID=UPI003A9936BD
MITLQNVQILWGLPINGDVVLGVWHNKTPDQWSDFAGQYLRIDVPPTKIKSGHILISALYAKLNEPVGDTIRSHQQWARVYLLAALSSFLFPGSNSTSAPLNYVYHLIDFERLSWGSAVLAHVYRNLCCTAEKTDQSDMNVAMLLVQHYLYERIPSLAPRLLRDIVLTSNALLNGPYGVRWCGPKSFEHTPTHVLSTCRSALSMIRPNERGAILFWATDEMQLPDRVCRQFGWIQNIPPSDLLWTPQQHHAIHGTTLRSRANADIRLTNPQVDYISQWYERARRGYIPKLGVGTDTTARYFPWYYARTIVTICVIRRPQPANQYRDWATEENFYVHSHNPFSLRKNPFNY